MRVEMKQHWSDYFARDSIFEKLLLFSIFETNCIFENIGISQKPFHQWKITACPT